MNNIPLRWTPSILAVLLLVASSGALAQRGGDVGALLAAMREASGGGRWAEVRSLHIVRTVAGDREEHWEDVRTGRYLVRQVRPSFTGMDGFDGITPWHQGRSGIAYALGDTDAARVAADESFRVSRAWWFPDRHAATIAAVGVRTEAGRRYDVLDITPEGGRPFQAWLDADTHLLARTDEQQAEDRVVTTYADYRPVDGLMLPFTIRQGDGVDPAADEVETVQEVDLDPPVPDSLYALRPRPPSDVELPPHHDRVDVPFRLTADNRIMVPVTVDGRRTLEAEFDSGGSLTLQPSTLAAMGVASAGRSRQGGGGEGITTSSSGKIATLALGDAVIRAPAFHSFAFAPDDPDRALLGLEVLQRFVVRFDFDRQVMTLTRPEALDDRRDGAIVPFHFQDNQPEVRGSVDGIAGLFTIDTGDSGSLLLIAPFARRYGLVERYHADLPYEGRAVGATHGVWARKRVGTVAFDGPDGRSVAEAHEPITRISLQQSGFDANRNVSANIGLGVLRQFNLTFDYVRERIILEPNQRYGEPDVFDRAGLHLKRAGAVWSVTAIYPGTPAAEAGIRPGDVVSRVDDQTPAQLDAGAVAARLTAPVGTRLGIDVGAPGAARHVTLVLRELL